MIVPTSTTTVTGTFGHTLTKHVDCHINIYSDNYVHNLRFTVLLDDYSAVVVVVVAVAAVHERDTFPVGCWWMC